ncbi:MAG: hypothetical protein EP343_09935 [Deltaproteobacteria bacterium]|nr:MAG: hypothetical protein EP343_09935 [Deltaproteobacteria bacterium]
MQQHEEQLQLHPGALRKLQHYVWPENVRQLNNVLQRAVALQQQDTTEGNHLRYITEDEIVLPSTSQDILETNELGTPPSGELQPHETPPSFYQSILEQGVPFKSAMESTERELITLALEQNRWKIQDTADALQITRNWLYKRMKKYGIE